MTHIRNMMFVYHCCAVVSCTADHSVSNSDATISEVRSPLDGSSVDRTMDAADVSRTDVLLDASDESINVPDVLLDSAQAEVTDMVDAPTSPLDTPHAEVSVDVRDADDTPAACVSPMEDCDGDPSNGCETNLNTNYTNCGGCGRACPSALGCFNGHCQSCCDLLGFGDCDGICSTGCETDLRTSPLHCGACNHPCAGETPRCVAAVCVR